MKTSSLAVNILNCLCLLIGTPESSQDVTDEGAMENTPVYLNDVVPVSARDGRASQPAVTDTNSMSNPSVLHTKRPAKRLRKR